MLTTNDLFATLANPEHLGWGFACMDVVEDASPAKYAKACEGIIKIANADGFTEEDLFIWSNSKWGRWMADGLYGCSEKATLTNLRRYVNAGIVADLRKDYV